MFNLKGAGYDINGTIDNDANTITAMLPEDTNLEELSPTIVIYSDAEISPRSGTPQNFTSPVVYVVTAEDESTRSYVVTISVFGPLYLYEDGVGGDDWVEGYTSDCGSIVKEETYLYLSAKDGLSTECTYVTDKTIDLTYYNTLYVEWDTDDDTKHTSHLDISTFLGSYYISVHHHGLIDFDSPAFFSSSGICKEKIMPVSGLEINGSIKSPTVPRDDSLKVNKVWLE